MCGAAPDESIASYSLRSVPPGSILLLLYGMNEVVMKLAGLNMLLNLRDRRFEIVVATSKQQKGFLAGQARRRLHRIFLFGGLIQTSSHGCAETTPILLPCLIVM